MHILAFEFYLFKFFIISTLTIMLKGDKITLTRLTRGRFKSGSINYQRLYPFFRDQATQTNYW
jgi:hypothetical protein